MNHQEIKQQKELAKYKALLVSGLIFAIPSFLISMVFMMIPALEDYFMYEIIPGLDVSSLILFLLATPVQFVLGSRFYIGKDNQMSKRKQKETKGNKRNKRK